MQREREREREREGGGGGGGVSRQAGRDRMLMGRLSLGSNMPNETYLQLHRAHMGNLARLLHGGILFYGCTRDGDESLANGELNSSTDHLSAALAVMSSAEEYHRG